MVKVISKRRFLVPIVLAGILLGVTIFFLTYKGENIGHGAGPTNIDVVEHWAWNEVIGWIDLYTPGTVIVSSSKLLGYASSSLGWISLDCSDMTSPCGSSNYGVQNDGLGKLSGFAWNDVIGWISFCGGESTSTCPGTQGYGVNINRTTGYFSGYAWNDVVGWISFNCVSDPDGCGSTNYIVKTSWRSTSTSFGWLDSVTYDTGVSGGAQINSIIWRGWNGSGASSTEVKFQMAFSNSPSGPWTFGWDGTFSKSPAVSPNTSLPVDYTLGANQRYFRYRIYLYSDVARDTSPRVDDVIVNWSR
jgi:hypothetical protein